MAACSSHWPVHQLWPPSGGKQRTELDVVLFHGLQLTANDTDAWNSTWTQRGHDDVCWPQKWLPVDLGGAVRIFSVSYNAHVVNSPHDHVSEIADNLIQTLINRRYEWHHPIVIIGHSFGGLVLKSLIVKLKRRVAIENATDSWSKATIQCAKMFLSNLKGVAFYAVPHSGSSNIAIYVDKLSCNNRHHCGIMNNILPWQRDMEELSVEFDGIVTGNEIIVYAFCEGKPMKQVGILVDFSSAQRSAGFNYYKVEDADHMEVCKPTSEQHPSYYLLLQLIKTCQEVAREYDQGFQEDHDLPQSIFGLERYVEEVETLVISERSDAVSQYVRVCGMGGVGKTLLLGKVYRSLKVRRCFQGAKFIWLTVGQTPDIMALYRSLSKELGLQEEKTPNPDDYKSKLLSQFKQKRVFLVLDDVWKDKEFDSLDLSKGKRSVTLLSTRKLSLLERADLQISQVHMTPLSKEDSWRLFCVHAFRPASNVPCELRALAQCMAEQCGGLPLALKVIGSAMFRKTLPAQWELLLKKLRESRMQESTVEDELYERLKVGYDCLSDDDRRLKRCFLYFAAFPEDFKISFHDILRHWIGERLVPGNVGDDPSADAVSLLDKLLERSFIEQEEDYTWLVNDHFFEYKLHDVMRDLAFFIVENGKSPAKQRYLHRAGQNLEVFPKEWKATSTKPSNARRLSLQNNNLKKLPESFYAPELVSLLLGNNGIISLPSNFLRSFRKLRLLDLRGGNFLYLPQELGDLKHLVVLDLSNCKNLKSLPDAVGKLHMLEHLDLRGCEQLAYLPSTVDGLTSLQFLCTKSCYNLTWAEQTPSAMASLEDIYRLNSLTFLRYGGRKTRVKSLHNISALTNLKILWLALHNVETLPADMPYWFIQLEQFHLWDFRSLTTLPNSFTCSGGFPALVTFVMFSCAKFVKFPEVQQGALPKLQTLAFECCMALENLPLSLDILPSLTKLNVFVCADKLRDCCRKNCEESPIWRIILDMDYPGHVSISKW